MEIKEKVLQVKDYLTKSNLPASDYVINPYIGCSHACKYCYACFMKRFTGHTEEWGSFIDVKLCDKPINLKKYKTKLFFFLPLQIVTIALKRNIKLQKKY